MASKLSPASLEIEMALRGWTNEELARQAGVSANTISAARQGRSVSAKTAHAIGLALALNPPVEGLEALVERLATR